MTNEIITGLVAFFAGGAAVYVWQRVVASKERGELGRLRDDAERGRIDAEREKSNAQVALRAKEEEIGRQRSAAEEALRRQADQYMRQIGDLNGKFEVAQDKYDKALHEVSRLNSVQAESRAALEAEKNRIADMRKHYEAVLEQMKSEFKSLSDEVLKEKREQLEKEGLAGVESVTEKLRKEIESFRMRVENVNKDDIERTASLKKEIEHLVSQTNLVSAEADKLATAIRAEASVTGQWGEIQLMRVLELGGLQRTVDYEYQETFASPGSARVDLRTDVLVKMPGERWVVIDAKTTMAAYADYAGEEGVRNAEAVKRIVNSLVEHVKEMKKAEYHKKLEATTGKRILQTMLMYIPFEEVYLMAMKATVDGVNGKVPLREWAWKNDIVFVNASGLIPIVRMLADLWARNRSEKKVLQIKDAAESLIEKFKTFIDGAGGRRDGFLAVGAGLAQAVNAYNESIKRLSDGRGSVIKKLTELKEMGVTAADKLPPPEQVLTRKIEAPAEAAEASEH